MKRGKMTEEHKRKISEAHKAWGDKHWSKRPEFRLKMSLRMKDKTYRKGKKLTDEQKKTLSEAHMGYVPTEQQKKRLSESLKRAYKNGRASTFTGIKGDKHHAWKGGVSSQKGYSTPYSIAYKARKKGAVGSFSPEEWGDLKKKYNYMCLCCKQQEPLIELCADHIVPLSVGGTNYISNIQPLCRSCNGTKYTKTINFIKEYENI